MTFAIPQSVIDNYNQWRKNASKEELKEWDDSEEEFIKSEVNKNKNVHVIQNGVDITSKYKTKQAKTIAEGNL